MLEAEVLRHGGVEQPERVGLLDLVDLLDLAPAREPEEAGRHLPHAVDRHDGGLVEAGEVIGRARVREMMLDALDLDVALLLLAVGRRYAEDLEDGLELLEAPALLPARSDERLQGLARPPREGARHVLEAVLLDRRDRPGVGDQVELVGADAGHLEAVAHGVHGDLAHRVLPAREALLLDRRDDLAIDEEGGGGVVPEGAAYAQDLHSGPRVYTR